MKGPQEGAAGLRHSEGRRGGGPAGPSWMDAGRRRALGGTSRATQAWGRGLSQLSCCNKAPGVGSLDGKTPTVLGAGLPAQGVGRPGSPEASPLGPHRVILLCVSVSLISADKDTVMVDQAHPSDLILT